MSGWKQSTNTDFFSGNLSEIDTQIYQDGSTNLGWER